MKFINVASPRNEAVESILQPFYDDVLVAHKTGNDQRVSVLEKEFVQDFLSKTNDDLVIELESDEVLLLCINTKLGLNLTHLTDGQTTFNLGGYLKLLAPTISPLTYYVVVRYPCINSKSSMAIKQVYNETGCTVMHGNTPIDVQTGSQIKLGDNI